MDKCTSHSPCFSNELTKNAEIKAMIETYNQKVNFFDFESLNQLTDCILKNREVDIKRCSTEHLFISVLEKERHI